MPFPSLCSEEVYFLVLEREHCEEGDFPEADPPSIHSTQECISILKHSGVFPECRNTGKICEQPHNQINISRGGHLHHKAA